MNEFELKEIIEEKFGNFIIKYPSFLQNIYIKIINRIVQIKEINKIIKANKNKYGFDFIDEVLEYLDFTYKISYKDKMKIPAEGKLIVVSNHPLGGLDGLILLKAIGEIRKDVKIIANDILLNIENLSPLFLPYDIFSTVNRIRQIKEIENTLLNDEAVIFFPAAEVSRLTLKGIKDRKWLEGPVKLARKVNSTILPVFIEGKNTKIFYFLSFLNKKLSILLLTREMLKKRKSEITLKISDPIPSSVFKNNIIGNKILTALLKNHVYKTGKGKKGIFKSEKNIIHPVGVKELRNELYSNKLIGTTRDNKSIFLVDNSKSENIIREISRLREITFRKVGEGTGKKADLDIYDSYYKHILLWDEKNLEIVGSYRLGLGSDIMNVHGFSGFYTYNQFLFSTNFLNHIEQGIELGRSFVQQKYWTSSALDYLWQGIGAFLREFPKVRYLFGTVSISDTYSEYAKDLIIYYYKKWYDFGSNLCISKNKYIISRQNEKELEKLFTGNEPETDFRIMKDSLKNVGYTIPILYRKYTDICDFGGVEYLDFGVDQNFGNSIDGFILVDLSMIKQDKKERYYRSKSLLGST